MTLVLGARCSLAEPVCACALWHGRALAPTARGHHMTDGERDQHHGSTSAIRYITNGDEWLGPAVHGRSTYLAMTLERPCMRPTPAPTRRWPPSPLAPRPPSFCFSGARLETMQCNAHSTLSSIKLNACLPLPALHCTASWRH